MTRDNDFALELLRGGASRVAFLLDESLPSMDTLLGAVREVRSGQTVLDPSIVDSLVRRRDTMTIDDLTLHESDVLDQMAHGLSNRAIAREFNVSIKAIEKYSTAIFRKLDLADRSDEDRRVSATLAYLRAYAGPIRPTTGNSRPGT